MRTPTSYSMDTIIKKLGNMRGVPLTVKVNRGRNVIERLDGFIENTYPNVFTVRLADGGLTTFAYADVMAHNILFYKRKA